MKWHRLTTIAPPAGRSYLIRSLAAGPVYDVAFYNGRNKEGVHWWTVTSVDIPMRAITHWANIIEPDDV